MPYLATVAVNLYPRRSWASGLWLLQLTPDRAVTVEAPDAAIADKGYDADHLVDRIAESGTEVVIPPKHNRKLRRAYDPELYKERNRIERFFNKLKQFRRVATQYDRLLANFMGFVKLATIAIWIR